MKKWTKSIHEPEPNQVSVRNKTSSKINPANATKATPLHARAGKIPLMAPRTDGMPGKPNDLSWHEDFICFLRTSANVTQAAKYAGVDRHTAYEHKGKFEAFKKAWEDAWEEGTDNLEAEAYRRAHDGTLKPIFQQGRKVGSVREYSDTVLIFLLKGRRPGVYGDKTKMEHSGQVTYPTDAEIVATGLQFQADLMKTLKAAAGLGKPVAA